MNNIFATVALAATVFTVQADEVCDQANLALASAK